MSGKVIEFIGRRACTGDCQQGRRCTCVQRWRDTADTAPMVYAASVVRRPRRERRLVRVLRTAVPIAFAAVVVVAAILVERHLRGLP